MRHALIVAVAACALTASATAWAQDSVVQFEAPGGYSQVQVTVRALVATTVVVEAGTVVETGDEQEQRLMLARTTERTLEAGETATFSVPSFCLDLGRRPPTAGRRLYLAELPRGTSHLVALLTANPEVSHGTMQQAMWDLRSGRTENMSPEVRAVLSRAGISPKVEPGQ